ncbi:GTP cyclohydrolase I [Deltaproteobacteria bacterium TL4]
MDSEKIELGFRLVLEGLGLDLNNPHFRETPSRVARAWMDELCIGLREKQFSLTTFPVDADYQPSMVVLQQIPVRSICAHHLLPFVGEATVAYIPDSQLCGLSKLSRVVDFFSRRPQVQENLTNDICQYLNKVLRPQGVGIIVKASHMCMALRGVSHPGTMTTSSLIGCFMEDPTVRAEFMSLAHSNEPIMR